MTRAFRLGRLLGVLVIVAAPPTIATLVLCRAVDQAATRTRAAEHVTAATLRDLRAELAAIRRQHQADMGTTLQAMIEGQAGCVAAQAAAQQAVAKLTAATRARPAWCAMPVAGVR